jgi:Na+/H+ antiporter
VITLVDRFEAVLFLTAACVGLKLLAGRIKMPPAAALVLGGAALALVRGTSSIALDPDLAMVLFLPPLLLVGAYSTDWRAFRADLRIILQLAIGAVVFTTLVVGWTAHAVMPGLPWAACFALGAIVSPPDAVAAKAVLKGLALPTRIVTLLEGESLVNDATGLVLYRFAVAAALTGVFDRGAAAASFVLLAVGGGVVGAGLGFLASSAIARIKEAELGVVATFLVSWGSYIIGEKLHVSGVLCTVACGMVMGWRQHGLVTAENRLQAQAAWAVVTFVLESLIFVLIGLSLRGVLHRAGGDLAAWRTLLPGVASIVAIVIAARFAWIVPTTYLVRALFPGLRRRDPYPPLAVPVIMSWAGMRGVVSLAAALALPDGFPGRDFILISTFAVILVTVLLQGSTLAPLIRSFPIAGFTRTAGLGLTEAAARARVASAELGAVEAVSKSAGGTDRHPRLVEQYTFRAGAAARFEEASGALDLDRSDHFRTVLAAVAAGRSELLALRQSALIDDAILQAIEHELDLDEMRARRFAMVDPR